jgi:hypothetical protein
VSKYLVLYHAPVSAREQMASSTPEEAAAGMEAWMAWAGRCGDALVDLGLPLGDATSVSAGSSNAADTTIAGFSILQADSADAAAALLDGHPHLGWGGTIELHEALPLPGM